MTDLSKLVTNIDSQNIAEDIKDENLLRELAAQVIEDFGRDQDSMSDWENGIKDGKKLAKQEMQANSDPWEGAANFKSPNILEAARSFGDRAVTEIVRGENLVKSAVIGADTQGLKKKAGNRVTEFMNWQINFDMQGWRERQECLVYELPATGAVFKKTFFDPIEGKNKSELIHWPDFAVNQATSTMEEAKSFTQIMDFSNNEIVERINAGQWSDVLDKIYPEDAEGDEGSNEEAQTEDAEENPDRFLEQNCLFDLDDDGYQEPYTVTVHEKSRQVVRIVARYDMRGIFVREATGVTRRVEIGDSLTDAELVKIEPSQNVTKYGFIKNPDGTFLDVGYYHLLGPLTKAINVTTNQLLDAGTLANMPNGFLARGFRKRMGNLKMKPGALEQTDISANELQSGVLMNPFREPSQTLLLLNEKLEAQVKELVVSLDIKGVLAPNAPATTTLALIQEAMLPSSAIMQRIIGAEGREFKKLFILNRKFADPAQYQTVLDDPEADYEADFNPETMDIMPTANPEMSSRMQRIQLADALIFKAQEIALTGGDVRPIYEMYFDALGAEELKGQVYPSPEDMDEEQAARIAAQQQQQEDQSKMLAIQVDHAEREIARKEEESRSKLQTDAANIRKMAADTLLALEKAESEEVKNRISVYTTQNQAILDVIDRELENEKIQREARAATEANASPTTSQQG